MKKPLLAAAALATAVLLVGCSAPATTPTPAPQTPVGRGPAGPGGPGGGPGGPGRWASPGSATTSGAASTPAPGTPAAAAWEALMAPDGEYAAAASYQAVLDKYGADTEPYATIRGMEERHIQALVRQLGRYGITAPANPYLGTIAAPASLQEAAQDWARGEDDNVKLYDRLLTQTGGDAALTRVFTNLRRSSLEAHLPLFEAAAKNGGSLTPQQMIDLGFTPQR